MSETVTIADLRQQISGSSFYAGMRILPKAEREAMYAIYGFCRMVDDIADDLLGDRASRAAALDQWRQGIDAIYAGADPGQASFLVSAVHQFDLDREDFHAVIDGMQTDIDADMRWPPFVEMDLYCDRVASAVGRLSVRVFGMEREPGLALAHHLGRALQFTNILRDIDEDAAIGRVYLPMEALAEAGITPLTPAPLMQEPNLDTAARWLAVKGQAHFAEANRILTTQPKGHLFAPRLMEAGYARLLRQMIAKGWHAPRHRMRTSKPHLALTALRLLVLRR